ncbi:MAG: UDP-N-acetylmuramoyl-tripeptide--D-alanyl-D-alanine ligase [Butyrivibrio sp.]
MDKLFYYIALGLFAPAFWGVLRYNLHMFQLNGYKNKEHIKWIFGNIQKQLILVAVAGLSVLPVLWNKIPFAVIFYIGVAGIMACYFYLRKTNTKKKLVFTKRAKRLVVTDTVLNVILTLGGVFAGRFMFVVLGGLLLVQPLIIILVNIINSPVEKGINRYYINDAGKILRRMPDLKIIGVTGSYGKTSVKYYLQTLLKSKYNVLVTPASYNTPMGVVKTIREELKPIHEIFVCEMGARNIGDIKELCDIVHPHYGVITSIGPQHLETFLNMDNIVNTKFELADALPENGTIFLNGDNEYIRNRGNSYNNRIFYSTGENKSGYYADNIKVSYTGTEFDMIAPDGSRETFRMKLVGAHNVINVAGAIAVANSLGIEFAALKTAVRKLQPVEHRMQLIEKGGVTIIDDAYNSNPVGSKAAVETLAMFEGTRILVTPGMVELGTEEERFNYEFGTYAAKCCDYIALVGRKHTAPIGKGIQDSGFAAERCRAFDRLEDAMAFAYSVPADGHKYILLENDLPDNY